MATPALASDFKEFLKLLNSNHVEYLLIGGYAVGIYGYIRATNDLDIWVNISPQNAAKIEKALREFGFAPAALTLDLCGRATPPITQESDFNAPWPSAPAESR